jgi:phosphate-selective porin
MHVTAQRRGQSIDDGDLPDIAARGWYLSGTWVLTEEQKTDNIRPARSLLQGGTGALELAARIERLGIAGSDNGQAPSRSPRAVSVLDQSNRALTMGINWYPHPNIKIQANAIRERLALGLAGSTVQDARWSRALRFQFSI